MTSKREDYLKAIYKLNEKGNGATHKRLCQVLGNSGASVSQMIKKLKHDQLVDQRLGRIYLTEEGSRVARELISVHRLWEVFLYNYLGLSKEEAHQHAEFLEHTRCTTLMKKLNDFLDRPKFCPHGDSIFLNK